jgi:hypothetical protein
MFEFTENFLFRKTPATRILDKNSILVLIFYFIKKKSFLLMHFPAIASNILTMSRFLVTNLPALFQPYYVGCL